VVSIIEVVEFVVMLIIADDGEPLAYIDLCDCGSVVS
jgi:hypothetical protein